MPAFAPTLVRECVQDTQKRADTGSDNRGTWTRNPLLTLMPI
ncbi:hypothetical protein BOO71_0007054 [Deinococcus marmoris]|uniref:Uncharacterized protein n=1 Tax=Deinococcus marmoris TaxID=249408 RepID=A0A1U7NYK8_9DEIO|nr:hypothetical protein BOO71_0007054 [Deinococcus marmoris]